MKHLLLKVYSAELDENHSRELPVKELINKTYLIDIDFGDIQNYIINLLGEGFRSESNSTQEYCILSVYIFWERDLTRFKDYFSKFKEIDNATPLKEFSNIAVNSYIQIEAEGMDLEDMYSIMNIIRVHNEQHKVIKGTQIFEKGASARLISFSNQIQTLYITLLSIYAIFHLLKLIFS
jgi:hypothetical protein